MLRSIVFTVASILFGFMITMFSTSRAGAAPPDTPPDFGTAEGSGSLDARKPDGTRLGPCPLERTDVQVKVSGFVARVTVTQRFKNDFTEPVEAVYTFPLSENAAVDAMWMRTADRKIRGTIQRREDARKIYEAARDQGQVAGLLDQERPNIFTQSIANLVPGAAVDIEIEYVEPLKYSAGTFEFVFPTVVGPRFVPGAPRGAAGTGWSPDTDRVPDGSRITPPVTPKSTRAGHDIRIAVDVDAGVPILDVATPLHDVVVTRSDPHRARVRLKKRDEIPNRDFVLRYAVGADQIQSGYLVHRPAGGDGYVSLVLLPPKRVTPKTAAPKELVFVIDRSGSQSGQPLEVAKATVLWILDHLNPNDTFQIVDFGNEANVLFATPQPVSEETKRRARAHLATIDANGGTMMAEAVRKVCAMPADGNRLRIVTFMTDGYIGNDFEVLELVGALRGTSRWFPFGTGNGVNRFLIEGMAREGGGEPEYVLLSDPTEETARRFYERIASPVLTDVRVEIDGLAVTDVTPRVLRDVWAERPLVVHGRYQKGGRGRVVLHGFQQGQPYRETIDVVLPDREDEHDALASMWARARVEELMAQDLSGMQSGEVRQDLRERIVELALAHRLVTQFTSFVAVEDKVVNEGGKQRTVAVPVEMPQGVRYEGVFGTGAEPEMMALAAAPPSGALASLSGAVASTRGGAMPKASRMLAYREAAPTAAAEDRRLRLDPRVSPRPGDLIAERDDAAASGDQSALDEKARTRLSSELVALLENGSASNLHLDGVRLHVRVRVAGDASAAAEALRNSGLDVETVDGACVSGWIEIGRLRALAEVDGVERVVAIRPDGTAAQECGA